MKTKLQKIEAWFDAKWLLGFSRATWLAIFLVVGNVINLIVIKVFSL